MEKKIVLGSCKECSFRCNASMHGWRNIYCEMNVYSITEEDDANGFPEWCELADN